MKRAAPALVLVAALGAAWLFGCAQDETDYLGVHAYQWIGLLDEESPRLKAAGVAGLARIVAGDPESFPRVVELFRREELWTASPEDGRVVEGPGLEIFSGLGTESIRELIQLLDEEAPEVQIRVWNVLAAMEERSLPVLTQMLEGEDVFRQHGAVFAISRMGPKASPAYAALVSAMRSPHEGVAGTAMIALGRMGPQANSAIPQLMAQLTSPDRWARENATEALALLGGASPEAKAALEVGRTHPNSQIGKGSAEALRRIAEREGGGGR